MSAVRNVAPPITAAAIASGESRTAAEGTGSAMSAPVNGRSWSLRIGRANCPCGWVSRLLVRESETVITCPICGAAIDQPLDE